MRKRLLAAAALPILLCAGEAVAESQFYAFLDAGARTRDLEVSGVLHGSLAPDVAFTQDDSASGAQYDLGVGYDHGFANGLFLAAEASLGGTALEQAFDPVVSSITIPQVVTTCIPPPPFAPPGTPCSVTGSITRTFTETQTLGLRFNEDLHGALVLKIGFDLAGGTRVFLGGGVTAADVEVRYDLPDTPTWVGPIPPGRFIGPFPPLPTLESSLPPSATLPAERRTLRERLTGWTALAGVEHRFGGFRVSLSYAYADEGEINFEDSARVQGLRLETTSQTALLSVAYGF